MRRACAHIFLHLLDLISFRRQQKKKKKLAKLTRSKVSRPDKRVVFRLVVVDLAAN